MKPVSPQSSPKDPFIKVVLSWILALVVVLIAATAQHILWPILRYCGNSVLNGMKAAVTRSPRFAPVAKPGNQLPTPDIFKDCPNLARAKEFRFK